MRSSVEEVLMSSNEPRPRLNWPTLLFLILTPLISAILVPLYLIENGFSWAPIILLVIFHAIGCMSITCGYHRYYSHRSYDVHPLIQFLYLAFGAGTFEGSALEWSTDHRRHHRSVDTENDPYSINKGFLYAHMGWLFKKVDIEESAFPKDLNQNSWVRFQHDHYVPIAIFMGFFFPALVSWALGFGFWAGLIFPGLLRIVISQHTTFLINSAAHTFGRQPYTNKNSARDSAILAFLTFGEGYHNFHHFFQADYRNGVRWYEFDPSKWWIRSLAFIGLASRLKRTRREEILKARLAMEERQLISKGACATKVEQLKQQVIEAQTRFRQLKDEYAKAKKSLATKSHELRTEIQLAKIEFRSAYGKWRTLRRSVRRSHAVA